MANVQWDFSESSQNYSRTFEGPTKNFVPEFDISLPMFRKNRQKWKLYKRYDSKNIFPRTGKYQLRHSCSLPFSEVWQFCSLFEKMLQCKTIFLQKKFLGKLLRPRKVQFWKQLKTFVRCPKSYSSNSENKHKLTTFPKTGPSNEPLDI